MRAITSPTARAANDMRWTALDLVCAVRTVLGLRDRDIATLRGLLSLIGPDGWNGPMMVHASNRVLQERCDGADERSLRRRLAKLVEAGLITRRQSPNHKRYVLRDGTGAALMTFGFDLSPLRDALPQLQEMAAEQARLADEARILRARLRQRLYEITVLGAPCPAQETVDEARLALRRTLAPAALAALLDALGEDQAPVETQQLTASDSQTDRHIESPRQESLKEELKEEVQERTVPVETAQAEKISLSDCLARLPDVTRFFEVAPRHWHDLRQLSGRIGRALGLSPRQMSEAEQRLGPNGAALGILGLAQAQGRIQRPQAYFNRILSDARRADFGTLRMFRALTRPAKVGFPAGNALIC